MTTVANRKKNCIVQLRNPAGNLTSDKEEMMSIAVAHFNQAFASQDHFVDESILRSIPSLVSQQDNEHLCAIPSEAEIRETVFSMSGDSTPGPDGYWPIISALVVNPIQDFFLHRKALPRSVTSTLIALIPKQNNVNDNSDYRPISLCNFFHKIISTIISNRLASVLPTIISLQQSAFVKGRQIVDTIALAQEMIHELGRKTRGNNVMFKLDMAKAYDQLEWDFLFAVLKRFGFSLQFISLIELLVNNCWFSVVLNGESAGFFKSSRGVRQGDPIAPSLFIIAE